MRHHTRAGHKNTGENLLAEESLIADQEDSKRPRDPHFNFGIALPKYKTSEHKSVRDRYAETISYVCPQSAPLHKHTYNSGFTALFSSFSSAEDFNGYDALNSYPSTPPAFCQLPEQPQLRWFPLRFPQYQHSVC
jgi:hypothetical protein